MNGIYPEDPLVYLAIFLIFCRLMSFLLLIPVLGHKAIPAPFRLSLGLTLSLVLYPVVKRYLPPVPLSIEGVTLAVGREVCVGLVLGAGAYVTMEAIALGAQLTGYQLGWGTAGLLDPHSQQQTSALAPLYGWMALMVILLADLHHVFLANFAESFAVTGARSLTIPADTAIDALIRGTGSLWVLAVRIAAPLTAVLLGCQVLLAILARLLPQMNVLFFSFPVLALAGLLTILWLVPSLADAFESQLVAVSDSAMVLLRQM